MAAYPQPAILPDTVCVAEGDGIGPEITSATLDVLTAAGAPLKFNPVRMGVSCFREDLTSGIPPATWDAIRNTGVLLKGPMTTPQGSGMKSLNVTLRKTLGLYANVRPVRAYAPFIQSNFPTADLVIVRENEEDLYAGIEHRQTEDVVQCLKLVSRPGCERIIRYAFEYVRTRGRKKLTCMTKDNIMKLTDGLFHQVFDEIASEYPTIEAEHMIIDIGMARVAARPQEFDVIVTPNLYGDILSDVAAEITGSVGIAPSANIGSSVSVFEAIHGSAPDIAGKDIANPSALLLSAAKMLAHLGYGQTAELVHNAWLCVIERGLHTADIYTPGTSKQCLGTKAFTREVINRLGQVPQTLKPATYPDEKLEIRTSQPTGSVIKKLKGVDVFVQSRAEPASLGDLMARFGAPHFDLSMITNRGVQVWPNGMPETSCTDHWRCRFTAASGVQASNALVVELLSRLARAGVDFVKTEHLYDFDGQRGYSLGQGQ